jgi:hypothetical protein
MPFNSVVEDAPTSPQLNEHPRDLSIYHHKGCVHDDKLRDVDIITWNRQNTVECRKIVIRVFVGSIILLGIGLITERA